jgi:hypothetical protein
MVMYSLAVSIFSNLPESPEERAAKGAVAMAMVAAVVVTTVMKAVTMARARRLVPARVARRPPLADVHQNPRRR